MSGPIALAAFILCVVLVAVSIVSTTKPSDWCTESDHSATQENPR